MSVPIARSVSGASPFTVACVPQGMNAGVATVPCAVTISPRRAGPSVASKRKAKASAIAPSEPSGPDYCLRPHAPLWPEQQAGIAIGVKPISVGDRMCIGALDNVQPAKRRDQHEQGRARQVKISEHYVDYAEMIAWRDEQGGLPLKWAEDTVVRSGTFQESQRGRSHR